MSRNRGRYYDSLFEHSIEKRPGRRYPSLFNKEKLDTDKSKSSTEAEENVHESQRVAETKDRVSKKHTNEKLNLMKRNYEEKLLLLTKQVEDIYSEVETDPLLKTLKADKSSSKYARERLHELIIKSIKSFTDSREQEYAKKVSKKNNYIRRLLAANDQAKSLNSEVINEKAKLENRLGEVLSRNSTLESELKTLKCDLSNLKKNSISLERRIFSILKPSEPRAEPEPKKTPPKLDETVIMSLLQEQTNQVASLRKDRATIVKKLQFLENECSELKRARIEKTELSLVLKEKEKYLEKLEDEKFQLNLKVEENTRKEIEANNRVNESFALATRVDSENKDKLKKLGVAKIQIQKYTKLIRKLKLDLVYAKRRTVTKEDLLQQQTMILKERDNEIKQLNEKLKETKLLENKKIHRLKTFLQRKFNHLLSKFVASSITKDSNIENSIQNFVDESSCVVEFKQTELQEFLECSDIIESKAKDLDLLAKVMQTSSEKEKEHHEQVRRLKTTLDSVRKELETSMITIKRLKDSLPEVRASDKSLESTLLYREFLTKGKSLISSTREKIVSTLTRQLHPIFLQFRSDILLTLSRTISLFQKKFLVLQNCLGEGRNAKMKCEEKNAIITELNGRSSQLKCQLRESRRNNFETLRNICTSLKLNASNNIEPFTLKENIQKKIATLLQSLDEKTVKSRKLERDLEESNLVQQSNRQKFEKVRQEAAITLKEHEEQRALLQEEMSRLRSEQKALNCTSSEAQIQLKDRVAENNNLKTQINDLMKQLMLLKNKNESLENMIRENKESKEVVTSTMLEEKKVLNEKIESLLLREQTYKNKVEELTPKINQLEEQLKIVKNKVELTEKKATKENNDMVSKLKVAELERESLKRALEDSTDYISMLNSHKEHQSSKIVDLEKKVKARVNKNRYSSSQYQVETRDPFRNIAKEDDIPNNRNVISPQQSTHSSKKEQNRKFSFHLEDTKNVSDQRLKQIEFPKEKICRCNPQQKYNIENIKRFDLEHKEDMLQQLCPITLPESKLEIEDLIYPRQQNSVTKSGWVDNDYNTVKKNTKKKSPLPKADSEYLQTLRKLIDRSRAFNEESSNHFKRMLQVGNLNKDPNLNVFRTKSNVSRTKLQINTTANCNQPLEFCITPKGGDPYRCKINNRTRQNYNTKIDLTPSKSKTKLSLKDLNITL
eukprot:snap_masked-scaffold_15-processed-gene-10.26-mRNA-1 protein AED:1.00 eAED:1.00 QI:0/-1/0/0/-1/1/1/0/1183